MTDHTPRHATAQLALRTLAAVGSTLVIALAGLVVALGLPSGVVSALQGPTPELPVIEVLPAEPDRVLVCMGPALSFGSEGSRVMAYGAPSETLAGSNITTTSIADTTVTDGFALDPTLTQSPPVIVSQPVEAGALAATSSQLVNNLNVTGLAVSECQVPERELWLVGGDTTTGRQTAISLVNPSDVQALVNLDVWGAKGLILAPLGRGILLPPSSQRVISLAGLAPGESSPVVRVSSESVGVVASMHSTIVRGLEADGLTVNGSQPSPSTLRVVTGVYTPPEEVIGPIKGKEGYRDVGAVLRLLSPDEDAEVRITVKAPGSTDSVIEASLVAGETTDLLLDEFNTGDIAVIAESDYPIVASLRSSVGTDERTDTDWVGSSPVLEGETAFAVPSNAEARVSFVNTGEVAITLTLDNREITVPARGLMTRPVSAGPHTLRSAQPVFAALSIRGETVMDSLLVLPSPQPQSSVMVSVR